MGKVANTLSASRNTKGSVFMGFATFHTIEMSLHEGFGFACVS